MLLAEFDSEGVVKHQFVGDINDYRKYALLRALSAGGANRIGVCWMLTPDDGGTHGGKTTWSEDMRQLDPPVSDFLQSINGHPERRNLWSIEQSGLLDVVFHSSILPQPVAERAAYMAECREKFADADLVFFDPDNGIDVPSSPIGRKTALKYVFLDEVAAFYGDRKSVLIYQHFPMMKVGADDALLAIGSTYANSSQSYTTIPLILVRDGRLELVDSIFAFDEGACGYERTQRLALAQGAGEPFSEIVATVTELTTLSGEECGRAKTPQAGTRTITVTYRWDAGAQRYSPDSDAFDVLARESEGRF